MKLALVTGSSRGVGEHTARALRSRGWTVVGVARGEAPASLAGDGGYRHHRLDLSDLEALEAWAEGPFLAEVGTPPERFALINNAGVVQPVLPLPSLRAADWSRILHVNVAAPALLTGLALRHFREVPLRVVDVSSGAATSAYPSWGPYCSSKAALRMLGQVVEREVEEVERCRHPDFALVCYSPGVVATRMQEEIRTVDEADFPRRQRFLELHEEGKLVHPSRPAAEIVTLVESDRLPRWSERRLGDPPLDGDPGC